MSNEWVEAEEEMAEEYAAPQKPFVRLSDEESEAILMRQQGNVGLEWFIRFARAIMDALEEKNK